eukprot:CAMPEP_0184341320 /NCGR_PEP_ID=MMETSP1089-20130417/9936_1 /TAXON_ID=38269 ORGANISM="Gloeochaete wittrockiana, Strain SAG46.84" /NCGR_SAMPLE_ID=MMETSP1089 /ASSEMBLY_ACC=CAM_ASM_000445 /LENGTH=92 /DNA_ID=CAMNT_0026669545 /DNA_START=31 /DNA_END=309 /DNA_ORIENTATION=-
METMEMMDDLQKVREKLIKLFLLFHGLNLVERANKVAAHKELGKNSSLALLGHHTSSDFIAGDVDELKVVALLLQEPLEGLRVLLGLLRATH